MGLAFCEKAVIAGSTTNSVCSRLLYEVSGSARSELFHGVIVLMSLKV